MKKKIRLAAEKHLKQLQRRRNWRKVVRAMACVVVFCTTYALILPAITMERDECTLTEHVHSESCYEKVLTETVKVLNCSYDSLGVHVHEADCLDAEGILICGEADYLVHTHSGECYDAEGSLVCELPKVEEHEHTEDCYGIVETEPAETEATEPILPEDGEGDAEATATEPALPEDGEGDAEAEATEPAMPEAGEEDTVAVRELICDKEVIVLHSHDEEDCYETYLDEEGNEQKRLICTQVIVLEHNHDESCFVTEEVLVEDADALTCLLAEGHVHAEACYDETGALICEEAENHTHGDMCYGTWTLICGQEEHTHDEGCVFPEEMEPNTLRYRGKDYEVTVRYEDSAEIPENAQLTVRELSGEEYREHLDRVYDELGMDGFNTLIQMETEEAPNGYSDENVAAVSGEIGFARFFDIKILADGQEIEPKSSVEVSIIYDESVEIPDGEKVAVHFNHNGTVEILEVGDGAEEQEPIEPAAYAARSILKTEQTQNTDSSNNVFVFQQDSFSITATIQLDYDNTTTTMNSNAVTEIEWIAESRVHKTLYVVADFGLIDIGKEKWIEVDIPTGFRIHGYSAVDATEEGDNTQGEYEVQKILISPQFRDEVASSSLSYAERHGGIVITGNSQQTQQWPDSVDKWEDQWITGYTAERRNGEASIRTYGGKVYWGLEPNAQHVVLEVSLSIQKELLSHTAKTETMGDIIITINNGTEKNKTTIKTTATDIPKVTISGAPGPSGSAIYYASLKSPKEGVTDRSDILPVSCTVRNYKENGGEYIAYAEKAVFVLEYPEGVYYEPETAHCMLLDLRPGQISLVNDNQDHNVALPNSPGKRHLSVKWNQEPEGGGTITWTLTNVTIPNYPYGECIGASFTADTTIYNSSTTLEIDDFFFTMTGYDRNLTRNYSSGPIEFTRKLVDGNEKDIRIFPRNFTRRNLKKDFGLENYDYVLGGFDVKSLMPYTNNNFYFTNPHGLKITALNLMGENIRNIIVRVKNENTGEERDIDVLDYLYDNQVYSQQKWIQDEIGGKKPDYYNERWIYAYGAGWDTTVHSGGETSAALVELSKIGGQPGEYISACYFTVDTDQVRYKAAYQTSGFTYIGEFDENETVGKDVYLQLLWDETTYEEAHASEEEKKLTGEYKNGCVYQNLAIEEGDQSVFGCDHTKIGWNNTGVGKVLTEVEHEWDDNGYPIVRDTYYPGSTIKIYSSIDSGYGISHQDILIDPTLVINLPQGMYLDLNTVSLYRGTTSVKAKVVEYKIGAWTSYHITQDSPDEYSWLAKERLIQPQRSSENYLGARFHIKVNSQCPNYTLSLQDLVMWDVRNTAGADVDLPYVTEPSKHGDAIHSSADSAKYVRADTNNFLRNGPGYAVANDGGTISTTPLFGLVTDLSIKPVENADDPVTDEGFTTYDGQSESIVWVKPGGYVDVKLSYRSVSKTNYFKGTVIYLPIPKINVNYFASDENDEIYSYFQNVALEDPFVNSDYRPFGFSMELVGEAVMKANNPNGQVTTWTTRYGIDTVTQNQTPHNSPGEGNQDKWEPVIVPYTWYPYSSIGTTQFLPRVNMLKFEVTSGSVPTGGTGSVIIRLKVRELNHTSGPAKPGTTNYWRGFAKAVEDSSTLQGEWMHTSVIAATPIGETVEGQFFVDADLDGLFDSGEAEYSGKKYTAEIYQTQNNVDTKLGYGYLNVDENGAFVLQDRVGKTVYLAEGNYKIKILKNNELDFSFANTNYSDGSISSSIGQESTEDAWYNNVKSTDGRTASFQLKVGNGSDPSKAVHRIGIGLKPKSIEVPLIGRKTLLGTRKPKDGEFTFVLWKVNGTDREEIATTTNNADAKFTFDPIEFDRAGKYYYVITEKSNGGYMTYDKFDHRVTVDIGWDDEGYLVPTVTYDNTDSTYAGDKNVDDMAAFTNSTGITILDGMIFIDRDKDGYFDDAEKRYTRGTKSTQGKRNVQLVLTKKGDASFRYEITANQYGYFVLRDSDNNYVNLEPGNYTLTVTLNDPEFFYANTNYHNSIGNPQGSPGNNEWHNNVIVDSADKTIATWSFTVSSQPTYTVNYQVGIAVNTETEVQLNAHKTLIGAELKSGDYSFSIEPLNGAPFPAPGGYLVSRNDENGNVPFVKIKYTEASSNAYRYQIKELTNNPKPGIIYDGRTLIAVVTVKEQNDGTLSTNVVYKELRNGVEVALANSTVAEFVNSVGYELPATGGAGTTSYTMGGLLMVTAAILLYIYTPKRRKEDHASF